MVLFRSNFCVDFGLAGSCWALRTHAESGEALSEVATHAQPGSRFMHDVPESPGFRPSGGSIQHSMDNTALPGSERGTGVSLQPVGLPRVIRDNAYCDGVVM